MVVLTMMKLHKVRTVVVIVALVARLNHTSTKNVGVRPALTGCTVQIIIDDQPREHTTVRTIAHGRVAHRLNQAHPNYRIVQSKLNQMQKF